MKLIDDITIGAKRLLATTTTQVKSHAPQIEFAVGAVTVIAGGCLLFIEGRRSKEKDFKAVYDAQVEEIEKGYTPKTLKAKAKRSAAFKYVRSEVSNVAPGAAVTLGGVLLMKRGFDSVMVSKRVLEAALAASVATNQKLNDILQDKMGIVAAEDAVNGSRTEEVEVDRAVNPIDGEPTIFTDSVTVFKVDDIFDLPGESFIYSKETCAGLSFQDDDNYVKSLVKEAVDNANIKLQHTHGYVFSEDLVRLFGVDPKPLHKTCGCVMPDPKHPHIGDELRKEAIGLNVRKIQIEYDDGSRTNGWLMRPVNDGSIIDIYPKYSLKRRLVKSRLEWKKNEQ